MHGDRAQDAGIILLLALLSALGPLSIDTYLPAMPAVAAEFGVRSALVEQSISTYLLGIAAGQIVCGPLSDRFGRRPILIVGLVLYVLATLICVYAGNIRVLLLGRLVQGLAASVGPAAGRAIVRDLWSGDRAARAMSLIMLVMAFAPMLAPLIGGQVFIHLGWRAIFWLMLGFGVLLLALVGLRLPETTRPENRAAMRIGTSFLAYGRVLASGRAWGYLLAGGLSYAVMFAYITGSPFVYIGLFDVSPKHFGFFFGLNVVGLMLGNWLNSRYVTRFGLLRLLGVGVAVSVAATLALLVAAVTQTGGLVALVLGLFVAVGPISMAGANAIAGLLDDYPRHAGAASALFGVAQFGFGALAGALVGVFHSRTATAMALAMALMAVGSFLAWLGLWLSRPTPPRHVAGA